MPLADTHGDAHNSNVAEAGRGSGNETATQLFFTPPSSGMSLNVGETTGAERSRRILTDLEEENMAVIKPKAAPAALPVLTRARELTKSLAAESDALNRDLELWGKQLKSLQIGIEASVPIGKDDQGDDVSLVFDGDDLTIETRAAGSNEWDLRRRPLQNASRAHRVQAACKMPDLLELLLESMEEQRERIREARTTLASVIDSVPPFDSGDDEIPF